MTVTTTRLHPERTGLEKMLGPLEAEIMQIVWSEVQPTTVKRVFRVLSQRRDIAYTTVMTTMERLSHKAILHRRLEAGVYRYIAAMTEAEFVQITIQRAIDGLLDDYGDVVIDALAQRLRATSPSEAQRLRDALA